MKKQDTAHPTNLTFILLGALSFQLSSLDGEYQGRAKQWFTTLFNSAKNLWFLLDKAMQLDPAYEEGKILYGNRSMFLNDCFQILVEFEQGDQQRILKMLNKEIDKSTDKEMKRILKTNK